jgi:hypothetical protein
MTRLPDHVVLVTTEGEWDTSAFMSDHPNLAAEVVSEAERRKQDPAAKVHVLRVPLASAAEIEATPAHQVPASLSDPP